MPTGAFQSQYWPADAVAPPSGATPGNYAHPYRHDGAYVGAFLPFFSLSRGTKKRLFHSWIKLKRLIPNRWLAAFSLIKLLFSDSFNLALAEVERVAKDPSTRNIEKWGEINRLTVSNPNEGENVYRHLSAVIGLPSSIPRQHRSLLVDLAWDSIRQKHGE